MIGSVSRVIHVGVVWLIVVATAIQVSLAFLGVPFETHRALGLVIGVLAVLLILIAFADGTLRTTAQLSVALLLLLLGQPVFAAFHDRLSMLALLHAFDALIILCVSVALAFQVSEELKFIDPYVPDGVS